MEIRTPCICLPAWARFCIPAAQVPKCDGQHVHDCFEEIANQPRRERASDYVEILGRDPKHPGRGYGNALLEWQIENHQHNLPNAPVFLDTAADFAQKTYERLGFVLIGKRAMKAEIDEYGCRAKTAGREDTMGDASAVRGFRAMMLGPTT